MDSDKSKEKESFSEKVGSKEELKIKAKRNKSSIWAGLGLFGMVGWTVVTPTLLGTALGIWLDKTYHQSFSWTLSCLVGGLFLGCLTAWNWINKEHTNIDKNSKNNHG